MNQKLVSTLLETLESTVFCFGEIVPDMITSDEMIAYEIEFTGGAQGKIQLVIDAVLGETMASNLLGVDVSVLHDEMIDDAIREILNILCGRILTSQYGEETVFDLGLPHGVNSQELLQEAIHLLIDDMPLSLSFNFGKLKD